MVLLLLVPEVPVALYDVGAEADSESCSDCRNCCRMSFAELESDELLVLSDEDELSVGGGPPWPPWPWGAPPTPPEPPPALLAPSGPLANAALKTPCSSVA